MANLIIDPGHGGTDPGANGFGEKEKDWNLEISLYQYRRLKELGAKVAITRTDDKTLNSTQRTNLIRNKYKYCMSNHFNAFNGKARGVETIHSIHNEGKEAKQLANAVVKASGLPLRRVFTRKLSNGQDYYFMHRLTGSTRTIIVEYGFIDNKADHDFYKNEKNMYKVAEAVVKEWCAILDIKYVAPGADKKQSNGGDKKLYRVQIGAFSRKDNADRMLTRAKARGFTDAFIKQEGKYFKVQIGAFSAKKNAENTLEKAKKAGFKDAFIA